MTSKLEQLRQKVDEITAFTGNVPVVVEIDGQKVIARDFLSTNTNRQH